MVTPRRIPGWASNKGVVLPICEAISITLLLAKLARVQVPQRLIYMLVVVPFGPPRDLATCVLDALRSDAATRSLRSNVGRTAQSSRSTPV